MDGPDEESAWPLWLAGACLGADGEPFALPSRDAGAESGRRDEVGARRFFPGLEPSPWPGRTCVSGALSSFAFGYGGTSKAVVASGETADGSCFKIVADSVHLNPVRSGWVGGDSGKRLRSWRWSSFGAYAGAKAEGSGRARKKSSRPWCAPGPRCRTVGWRPGSASAMRWASPVR